MRWSDARARLVVLAVCSTLLAAVLVVLVDRDRDSRPLEAAPAAAKCADVLLVLVPGNGEGVGTKVTAGRTLAKVRDGFRNRIKAHRSVEVQVVQFRSKRIAALRPEGSQRLRADRAIKPRHVLRWWRYVPSAIKQTTDLLDRKQRECPQQDLVFGGYAQGAAVVHRALAKYGKNSSVVRRTVGGVLISDPDRRPRTIARLMGDPAAPRSAIGVEHRLRNKVADVPRAGTGNRIISLCRKGDLVCDFGKQPVVSGITRAWTYYAKQATVIDRAAADLYRRTWAVARPRPADVEVSGMTGVPLTKQLTADTRPIYRANLRWRATSALPPGLTLSARGVLTGTPTTADTVTFRSTVRNSVFPAVARELPGTVKLKIAPNRLSLSSAGGDSSCTVKGDYTMWCWGDNYEGQLGQGNRTNQLKPVQMGGGRYWADVSVGGSHMCGIRTGGGLWCVGRNDFGQLGDGTRTRRTKPVRVAGGHTWAAASASVFNTCGITRARALYCWGKNDEGAVGDGTTTTRLTPARIGKTNDWAGVSSGVWHTCAWKYSGNAWCWGDNSFGQLGADRSTSSINPARVAGSWSRISAGSMHTCGLTNAAAMCWGANTSGQLGDGTRNLTRAPVAVAGGHKWLDVEVGTLTTCGVDANRTVQCWGAGQTGTLGRGGVRQSDTPMPVSGGDKYLRVNVGWAHACGTRDDGSTMCWGLSSAGQVGDGTHSTRRTPTRVLGG
jgi:alpha-tubulin suppressor-like RCC1 family protein